MDRVVVRLEEQARAERRRAVELVRNAVKLHEEAEQADANATLLLAQARMRRTRLADTPDRDVPCTPATSV